MQRSLPLSGADWHIAFVKSRFPLLVPLTSDPSRHGRRTIAPPVPADQLQRPFAVPSGITSEWTRCGTTTRMCFEALRAAREAAARSARSLPRTTGTSCTGWWKRTSWARHEQA